MPLINSVIRLIKMQQLKFIFFAISSSLLTLTACTSGDATDLYESIIVELNDVQSLTLSSLNTVITTGDSLQINATAKNSLNEDVDLTEHVRWRVSDTSYATINSNGLLSSKNIDGAVIVTANLARFSADLTISLSSAILQSIEINADTNTPTDLSTSVCRSLPLKALGTYDDSSVRDITTKVDWSISNNPSAQAKLITSPIVSISDYKTNTPALKIRAAIDTILSEVEVSFVDDVQTSSLVVTPTSVSLTTAETKTFQATADFTSEADIDVAGNAYWQSSDTSKADFKQSDQLLTAIAATNSAITVSATCGSQTTTAQVSVSGKTIDRVEILPSSDVLLSMSFDSTYALKAYVYYTDGSNEEVTELTTWTATHPSSSQVVVTVSNTSPTIGLVTAQQIQDIDHVKAEYAGYTDKITIAVTP